MDMIEIPYSAEGTKGWTIPIPGDGERQFASRDEALAFARTLAQKHFAATARPSYLCVEGGDGHWRLFTADLMPVH
ncbi:MAG TPA: DUF2188 domain-containing protein [Rhodanobacter sp.]|nr:DUF2188 domain-containing protein [Rhodanobacter sp.]